MKKKTKERLDRIEKRLQQLVEEVGQLKGSMINAEGLRQKNATPKRTQTRKTGEKRGNSLAPKKTVVGKQSEGVRGTSIVEKTATKLESKRPRQHVRPTAKRHAKLKSAATSTPKLAPKSTMKMFRAVARKSTASVVPAAVVSQPETVTQVDTGSEITA